MGVCSHDAKKIKADPIYGPVTLLPREKNMHGDEGRKGEETSKLVHSGFHDINNGGGGKGRKTDYYKSRCISEVFAHIGKCKYKYQDIRDKCGCPERIGVISEESHHDFSEDVIKGRMLVNGSCRKHLFKRKSDQVNAECGIDPENIVREPEKVT